MNSPTTDALPATAGMMSIFNQRQKFWAQNREASLNWLALGLLLAAWNAVDGGENSQARRRPDSLRGYSCVSVRAVHHTEQLRR